jgi:Flp pilus assembly pilin Flp
MKKKSLIKRLTRDQRGLATMEYGVLFVIIIVGAVIIWSKLGSTMTDKLSKGTDDVAATMDKSAPSVAGGSTNSNAAPSAPAAPAPAPAKP